KLDGIRRGDRSNGQRCQRGERQDKSLHRHLLSEMTESMGPTDGTPIRSGLPIRELHRSDDLPGRLFQKGNADRICALEEQEPMIRSIAAALALLSTVPVITETVDVRGRGPVGLASYACTDTPRSTIVQRVCYDAARSHLLINSGGTYSEYCRLPAST